jgi:GMP synthase (glutamine-hydrolysing)
MASPIACLHHLTTPVLGFAAGAFAAAGVELVEIDVARGEPLPALDALGGVLTLGGDQSVVELDGQVELSAEVAFLRAAVAHGLPVLGVCLGGQLLARALDAPVTHMPEKMVGWYEVSPAAEAAGDPLFSRLPDPVTLLHWNEDAFALPDGAVELLSRAGPGVEAFRYGRRAWGVQCHPEADGPTLDGWYAEEPEEDSLAARAADARNLPAQRETAAAIFGGFADVVVGAR